MNLIKDLIVTAFKMPTNNIHVRNSLSDSRTAKKIHRTLDYPFGMTHFEYRNLTHNPAMAYMLGYMIGGRRGGIDALRHLLDDAYVSALNDIISKAE